MKNTHKVILILTLTANPLIVQAQGMSFIDFDADKNGIVSEQEFNTARAERIATMAKEGRQMRGLVNAPSFNNLDTNHDGQLTTNEMQQMQQGHGNKRQGRGLGKGQGKGKGMGRPPQPVFADFDANKDNSLTEQEYYEARNKRIADRAKEGRQMRGLADLAAFTDIDGNADGTVSQEEFALFVLEHEKSKHH